MSRAELLERLQSLQNLPELQGRNIRSIAPILSNDALAKHVEACEATAARMRLQ